MGRYNALLATGFGSHELTLVSQPQHPSDQRETSYAGMTVRDCMGALMQLSHAGSVDVCLACYSAWSSCMLAATGVVYICSVARCPRWA